MSNPTLVGTYITRCFDAVELDNPRFLADEIIYLAHENKLTEKEANALLVVLRAVLRCFEKL